MKQRCPACNAKIRSDESECPKCGYQLYSSQFGNIAGEVNYEMSKVSDSELVSIAKENVKSGRKLTIEEFEDEYFAQNKMVKPVKTLFNRKSYHYYEKALEKAYKRYLEQIGYK